MYSKAEVRLEGSANREWTLTKNDGTTEKYYSIEGSPQRVGDDERVFDYDSKLGDFLEDLSFLCEAEENEVIEFEVQLPSKVVTVTLTEVI